MAPPLKFPPIEVEVRERLADCRRLGFTFAAAWAVTVREGQPMVFTSTRNPPALAVRWPSDRPMREAAKAAILGTKETWQRCYERAEATRAEQALAMLAPLLEELVGESGEPAAQGPMVPHHPAPLPTP